MEDREFYASLPPLEPGTVLNGRGYGKSHRKYEILELTNNNGGFGRIYRARCMDSSRSEVAIKEFHLLHNGTTGLSKVHTWTMEGVEKNIDVMKMKFREEAKLLSMLARQKDMHVPRICGLTWTENGRLFYAMEFIKGKTLRETMVDNAHGYVMPEDEAVGYIIQIARRRLRRQSVCLQRVTSLQKRRMPSCTL